MTEQGVVYIAANKRMRGIFLFPTLLVLLLGCVETAHCHDHLHHHHGHGHHHDAQTVTLSDTHSRKLLQAPEANITGDSVGGGFNAPSGNDSFCGAPLRKESLSVALSIYFETLQAALPENMTYKGNLTFLSQWRSILKEPQNLLPMWNEVRQMAKEYFNLTIPSDLRQLKLPGYSTLTTRRKLLQTADSPYVVPTYVTVVTDSTLASPKGGQNVTAATIDLQMEKLNSAFNKYGFQFVLQAPPEFIENPSFYNAPAGSSDEFTNNQLYRKGGSETLNIFVRTPLVPGAPGGDLRLGYAHYPESNCIDGAQSSTRLVTDAVVLYYQGLPGQHPLLNGATGVHEVGHWLGLPHTFNEDGSCDPNKGDGIQDTPVENGPYSASATFKQDVCNVVYDSCPSQPGFDSIDNYMAYSSDSCQTTFTPWQVYSMQMNWYYFRYYRLCSFPGQSATTAQAGPSTTGPSTTGKAVRSHAKPLQILLLALASVLAIMYIA